MRTLRILAVMITVALLVLAVPTAQGQVMQKAVNFQDLVYYNGTNEESWIDAFGPNAVKFIETFDQASWADSANTFRGLLHAEYTPTETVLVNLKRYANPGTYSDSSFALFDTVGGVLKLMARKPVTTNRSGVSIQGRTASFVLDTTGVNHPLYFGIRFKMLDSLQRFQTFIGLAAPDTTTYDTTLVGVGFWKPASNLRTTLIDTFQTVIKSAGTTKTQDQITADSLNEHTWEKLELFFTGDSINFYHNGTLVKQRGSNIPTTARLTPTVDIRNISTSASLPAVTGDILMLIDWIKCIQINTP